MILSKIWRVCSVKWQQCLLYCAARNCRDWFILFCDSYCVKDSLLFSVKWVYPDGWIGRWFCRSCLLQRKVCWGIFPVSDVQLIQNILKLVPLPLRRWQNIQYRNSVLFEMNVLVLTTCHTQYTWDSSICIFLFNRTTPQVCYKPYRCSICAPFVILQTSSR